MLSCRLRTSWQWGTELCWEVGGRMALCSHINENSNRAQSQGILRIDLSISHVFSSTSFILKIPGGWRLLLLRSRQRRCSHHVCSGLVLDRGRTHAVPRHRPLQFGNVGEKPCLGWEKESGSLGPVESFPQVESTQHSAVARELTGLSYDAVR